MTTDFSSSESVIFLVAKICHFAPPKKRKKEPSSHMVKETFEKNSNKISTFQGKNEWVQQHFFGEVEQIISLLILKSPYLAHMFYWFANM
jgi:hypothetical protein